MDDADVLKCIRMLTFLPLEQIDEMERWQGAQLNEAKEILAHELTALVHGKEQADQAREASHKLFDAGNGADAPQAILSQDLVRADGSVEVLSMLVGAGLCSSRSEARRAVEQGGVSVDGEKVTNVHAACDAEKLQKDGVLLRRGKKNFKKVVLK